MLLKGNLTFSLHDSRARPENCLLSLLFVNYNRSWSQTRKLPPNVATFSTKALRFCPLFRCCWFWRCFWEWNRQTGKRRWTRCEFQKWKAAWRSDRSKQQITEPKWTYQVVSGRSFNACQFYSFKRYSTESFRRILLNKVGEVDCMKQLTLNGWFPIIQLDTPASSVKRFILVWTFYHKLLRGWKNIWLA